MDFKYPQLWQNLDSINALAGTIEIDLITHFVRP